MQVLILERSYTRVRDRLEQSVPGIEPLLMKADGSLELRGRPIAAEAR